MRRRDFIRGIAGSAVVWPLAAHEQQPERMRCVGILMPLTADDPMTKLGGRIHAGTGGGWIERRPKPTDRHAWGGEVDSAMELVALTPDVISSIGTNATVALQQASRTVPVCQRTSGFSAPDVNGFRHRSGSNKALACDSQNSPEKSRAVRVLDREELEPILSA